MREFITAAKVVRDIFTELEPAMPGGGAALFGTDDHGRHYLDLEQFWLVVPVAGKRGPSHCVGDLLAEFDREHAKLQVPA